VTGTQLQMQTQALGWEIDDILVQGKGESSETRQFAVSCKSNIQVTSSGLPVDFVSAAWRLWGKTEPFRRGTDCVALVTRGRNATFDSIWSDMLIRLTPESQLDDPCRYGAAGLSKDHARVSRSIVLTRGLPGLLGTVSLARRVHLPGLWQRRRLLQFDAIRL
jgi:hypothetical protein